MAKVDKEIKAMKIDQASAFITEEDITLVEGRIEVCGKNQFEVIEGRMFGDQVWLVFNVALTKDKIIENYLAIKDKMQFELLPRCYGLVELKNCSSHRYCSTPHPPPK